MTPSRLRAQGFINFRRKLLFRLITIALLAYLFYAPSPWHPGASTLLTAQVAGSLLIFAGIIGRVFSTISIGSHKDRRIVTTELYSVCRNPLYFSSSLIALGVGALSGRADFTLLTIAAFAAIFYPMMLNEAKYLRGRFVEFADYETKVPLFFPDISLWKQRSSFEINFQMVKRTLFDACLALPVIPLMILAPKWF